MPIYANRGMALEEMITFTNEVYAVKNWADVEKKPTPVKILKVSAGGRVDGVIQKSTIDFYGTFRGRSIRIEAKSTKDTKKFPLENTDEEQINYLRKSLKHGALTFLIIEFSKLGEVYYVPAQLLIDVWDKSCVGGPKSIPYSAFHLECDLIKPTRGVPLDYLAIVEKHLNTKSA
ncbi:Holliday junction resolvase RecU [Alicyclobacillus fodiniaquatilis]|uniref:Holliday junction resolvase RecU n=1 Tax=Alicyclobacillus fodiniaquatilis TaxID=1661150 RepID=A0ABW4JJT8_9BACL